MTYLEQFTEDQVEMLAALPYRTGLLVGEGDATGGQEASAAEMRALESIVAGYVEDFCKSEFVEELMRHTLARRQQWDNWRGNIENVPSECRAAVELLASHIDHKQLTAFKQNLIEIAFAVAMAYREYDPDGPLFEKIRVHTDYYMQWIRAYMKKEKILGIDEALNISRSEQKLIVKLEEALQPHVVEGLEPRDPLLDMEDYVPPPSPEDAMACVDGMAAEGAAPEYAEEGYYEGEAVEGEYTEGEYIEGDAAEGQYTEGEYVEGEVWDDAAAQGQPAEEPEPPAGET